MNAPADLQEATDEDIVALAQEAIEANRDADLSPFLTALYERHFATVKLWCTRVCGDPDRAEDAAQEVFLRLQSKLDSFEGNSRFSTWLYSMTRRTTLNFLQRPRHRQEDRGNDALDWQIDGSESELTALARRELMQKVTNVVNSELEPLPRQVVYLHYVAGMSLSAIDQQLGLTNKSGAKAYLVSAQRTLRKSLGGIRAELEG